VRTRSMAIAAITPSTFMRTPFLGAVNGSVVRPLVDEYTRTSRHSDHNPGIPITRAIC
jgi:hypothetical protein